MGQAIGIAGIAGAGGAGGILPNPPNPILIPIIGGLALAEWVRQQNGEQQPIILGDPTGIHDPNNINRRDDRLDPNDLFSESFPSPSNDLDLQDLLERFPDIPLPFVRLEGFPTGQVDPRDFIFASNEAEKAANEARIDNYLQARGETVIANPREGQAGAGRQGDRFVNGELTEYKTLGEDATPNTIYRRVNKSLRGGGQAPNVIVDLRGTSITLEGAEDAIERIIQSPYIRDRLDSVRLIGNNPDGSVFDITRHMPR